MHSKIKITNIKDILKKYKDLNQEMRNSLIEHFMPLAERIASKYYCLGVDDEDILMSAYEGLIKALDSFKEKMPGNYLDYLEHKIETSIKQEYITNIGLKTLFRKTKNKYGSHTFFEIKRLERDLGRKPSIEEILEKCSSLEDIKYILKIENMIENLEISFMSYEKLDTVLNGNINIENLIIHEQLLEKLSDSIKEIKLTESERYVILHKYNDDETQKSIAIKLGVSQPRISQLESRALIKLRNELKEYFEELYESKESIRVDVRSLTYKIKRSRQ